MVHVPLAVGLLVFVIVLTGCARPGAEEPGAISDGETTPSPTAASPPTATPDPAPPTDPTPAPDGDESDSGPATPAPDPSFAGSAAPLDEDTRARMTGISWRPGCPVDLDDLRLLHLDHWDFAGNVQQGELVVHADHAEAVVTVFEALFEAGFPIERMQLVDDFDGSDDASMAANNTSGFNCRGVGGDEGRWSQHAYGLAIDVNPVQNPYLPGGGEVLPPAARDYVDRSLDEPGMIHPGGPVVEAFADIGWSWGGDWSSVKDYHHFSATGR